VTYNRWEQASRLCSKRWICPFGCT